MHVFESLTLNLWWHVNESFQILSIWVKKHWFSSGLFACFPMEALFSGLLPGEEMLNKMGALSCSIVFYVHLPIFILFITPVTQFHLLLSKMWRRTSLQHHNLSYLNMTWRNGHFFLWHLVVFPSANISIFYFTSWSNLICHYLRRKKLLSNITISLWWNGHFVLRHHVIFQCSWFLLPSASTFVALIQFAITFK